MTNKKQFWQEVVFEDSIGIPTIPGTDGIGIPVGNNNNRPTPVAGVLRFNTSISGLEVYNGIGWEALSMSSSSGMGFLPMNGGTIVGDLTLNGADIIMTGDELVDGRDLSIDGMVIDQINGISSGFFTKFNGDIVSRSIGPGEGISIIGGDGSENVTIGFDLSTIGVLNDLTNYLEIDGNGSGVFHLLSYNDTTNENVRTRLSDMTSYFVSELSNNFLRSDQSDTINGFLTITGGTSTQRVLRVEGSRISVTNDNTDPQYPLYSISHFPSDPADTGIYSPAIDEIGISIGGVSRVHISEQGLGINTAPSLSLDVNGTDAIRIPIGTTEQRPDDVPDGAIRYNSELMEYEGVISGSWQSLIINNPFIDPTTAAGDMIIRDNNNALARLPLGSNGRFLISEGGQPNWGNEISNLTIDGDLTINTDGNISILRGNISISQGNITFSDGARGFVQVGSRGTFRVNTNNDDLFCIITSDEIRLPELPSEFGDNRTDIHMYSTTNLIISIRDGTDDDSARFVVNTPSILGNDGTFDLPFYSWVHDPDTGIYRIGDDNIGISVNGRTQIDISEDNLNINNATITLNPNDIDNGDVLISENSGILIHREYNQDTIGFLWDDANEYWTLNRLSINGAFTFPDTDGSPNQIMVTDGNGNVAWENISALPSSNAATLDNLDSSQFLRSDQSDTMDGFLTVNTENGLGMRINATGESTEENGVDSIIQFRVNSGGPGFDGRASFNVGVTAFDNDARFFITDEHNIPPLDINNSGEFEYFSISYESGEITFSNAYTFPRNAGENGQTFVTDENGNIDWGNPDAATLNGIDASQYVRRDVPSIISQSITFSDQIYVSDGTMANPSIGFTNDPDTGIYHIRGGTIGISTNGQKRIEIQDGETIVNNALSINGEYTFPSSQGNDGRVLVANGDGTTSWNFMVGNLTTTGTFRADSFMILGSPPSTISHHNDGTNDVLRILGLSDGIDLSTSAGNPTLRVSNNSIQGFIDGTESNPYFTWTSDNDTGIYRIGDDAIGISTNGENRIEINDANTVINSLNVNGEYTFPNADGSPDYVLSTDGDGNVSWVENSNNGGDAAMLGGQPAANYLLSNTDDTMEGTLTFNRGGGSFIKLNSISESTTSIDFEFNGDLFWYFATSNSDARDFFFCRWNDDDVNPVLEITHSTGAIKFNDAYTFPTSVGEEGQILSLVDDSGNLGWVTNTSDSSQFLRSDAASTATETITFSDSDISAIFSSQIQVANETSASTPSIAFQTNTNTGIYSSASNIIGISTNGSERLRISPTGDITFNNTYTFPQDTGMTNQALISNGSGNIEWGNPDASRLGGQSIGNFLRINAPGTATETITFNDSDTAAIFNSKIQVESGTSVTSPSVVFGTDTNTGIYSPTSNTVGISTDGTERLRIDPSGNIQFNDAYTFPTTLGQEGQILVLDNDGNLDWMDNTSSGGDGGDATTLGGEPIESFLRSDESDTMNGTLTINRDSGTFINLNSTSTTDTDVTFQANGTRQWRFGTHLNDRDFFLNRTPNSSPESRVLTIVRDTGAITFGSGSDAYTFPTTIGENEQILVTDGSGILTWRTITPDGGNALMLDGQPIGSFIRNDIRNVLDSPLEFFNPGGARLDLFGNENERLQVRFVTNDGSSDGLRRFAFGTDSSYNFQILGFNSEGTSPENVFEISHSTGSIMFNSEYTFPTTRGTNGQVLVATDNNGTLGWGSVSVDGTQFLSSTSNDDATGTITFNGDPAARFNNQIFVEGTTSDTSPSIAFGPSDSNTGIFSPSENVIGISTGGAERFRIESNGNIRFHETNTFPQNLGTGSNNQALVSNGSGVIQWGNPNAATLGGEPIGSFLRSDEADEATSLTFSGQVTIANGSASAPSINFTSDPNTGIYYIASDTVGISTGGQERLRIGSNGAITFSGYTFPNNLGENGQVLITDADGDLTWGEPNAATLDGINSSGFLRIGNGDDNITSLPVKISTNQGSNPVQHLILNANNAPGTSSMCFQRDNTNRWHIGLTSNDTNNNFLIVRWDDSNNSDRVLEIDRLTKSIEINEQYTLPTTHDGTANQIMSIDANGISSWRNTSDLSIDATMLGGESAANYLRSDTPDQANSLSFIDGSASNPSISFTDDTDTGIYRIANNTVGISTDGAERLRINSSGNIQFNGAYTFPNDDGNVNQVLTTDGSGNITWVDNTSSGGNANTLDNLDSSQFLRSDTDDTMEGTLTFSRTGGPFIKLNSTSGNTTSIDFEFNGVRDWYFATSDVSARNFYFCRWSGSGDDDFNTVLEVDYSTSAIKFNHESDSYTFPTNRGENGQVLITDADGDLTWGELNAITLDGIDSSQFLRSDENDTTTGTITFSHSIISAIFLNQIQIAYGTSASFPSIIFGSTDTRSGIYSESPNNIGISTVGQERLQIDSEGNISFNNAYTFPNTAGSNGDTFITDGSGNITWGKSGALHPQTVNGNTNAINGVLYIVDTSGGVVTITLPASPDNGDKIGVADSGSNFSTNNLIIGRNGHDIAGIDEDLNLDIDRAIVELVYINGDWRLL